MMATRLGYLVDCTADTLPVVKGASSNTLQSIANAAGYLTNDGAGSFSWSATAAIATPGTLTVATVNSAAGNHTHAITTSANPGAAASILASDASGYLQLERIGVGIAPTHKIHIQDTVGVGKTIQIFSNAGELAEAAGLWLDQTTHAPLGTSGPVIGFEVDGVPLWEFGMDYEQVDFALVYSATLNEDIIYVDTVGTVGIGATGSDPGAQLHIVNPAARDYPALMVSQEKTTQPVAKFYTQPAAAGNGIELRRANDDALVFYVSSVGAVTSVVATGTSPYACSSTTVNANLNADMTDGAHLSGAGFTLTIPATGTAALLAAANVFTATNTIQTALGGTLNLNNTGVATKSNIIHFQSGGASTFGFGTDVDGDNTNNFFIYNYSTGRTAIISDSADRVGIGVQIKTVAARLEVKAVANEIQELVTGHTTQTVATPMVQFTRADAAAGVSAMLGLTCLGSGANGDGGSVLLNGKSSSTAAQAMGLLSWQWVDATHASRKAKVGISAYDTAVRLGLEIAADGVGVTTKTFGGQLCKVTDVNDTYTILASDYMLSCSKATPFTVTLPAAVVGQVYIFKNYGAGNVTITAPGADTFDEVDSDIILTQYDSVTLICRAANAWVIA